jgi:hypothetical protein
VEVDLLELPILAAEVAVVKDLVEMVAKVVKV